MRRSSYLTSGEMGQEFALFLIDLFKASAFVLYNRDYVCMVLGWKHNCCGRISGIIHTLNK